MLPVLQDVAKSGTAAGSEEGSLRGGGPDSLETSSEGASRLVAMEQERLSRIAGAVLPECQLADRDVRWRRVNIRSQVSLFHVEKRWPSRT